MNTDTPSEYSPPLTDPVLDSDAPTQKWSNTTHYLLPVIIYSFLLVFLCLGFAQGLLMAIYPLLIASIVIWATIIGVTIPLKNSHHQGDSPTKQILKDLLGLLGQATLLISIHILFIIIICKKYGGYC